MATALQGFRLTARCCACSPLSRRYAARTIARRRAFATTPLRYESEPSPQERDLARKVEKAIGYNIVDELEADKREFQEIVDSEIEYGPPGPDVSKRKKKMKDTFLNYGEKEPYEDGDFEEDTHDDLPTLAHGELEQHREWRHYARLAAWEMPLLSSMLLSNSNWRTEC